MLFSVFVCLFPFVSSISQHYHTGDWRVKTFACTGFPEDQEHHETRLQYLKDRALTPNPIRLMNEADQYLAEKKSVAKAMKAEMAEFNKKKEVLNDLLQLYKAGLVELEEIEKRN
ncbi:hypothetical protein EUTSA_v10022918mg [Eutrema salsugineum]|uniref:Uncharacterized protein n=1 Tax=Eutrema salsugineum TaxID=72664 RepID=V4M3H7_EUTSA|nr:hypothetical protein EUTSA_v10022918mg [Eutrema salsugineum]